MGYQPRDPETQALYRGRCCTFRTAGLAGTVGQVLFSLMNGSSSARIVHINQIAIDLYQTAAKTVAPPVIRIYRITAASGGTALTKVPKDTNLTSDANVTILGDVASDGTTTHTAITATGAANGSITNLLTQEYAPRALTLVGYEPFDRTELLEDKDVVLRPGQGVAVRLDYTVATSNPTSDMYIVSCDWWESA